MENRMGSNIEMRSGPRKEFVFMPVNYYAKNRVYLEIIKDLSATGAAIETNNPLFVGEQVIMTFMEDYEQGPLKLECDVVRSWMRGFAVRFRNITEKQEQIVKAFIITEH